MPEPSVRYSDNIHHTYMLMTVAQCYNTNVLILSVALCQVVDISPSVHKLYYLLDPVSLEVLVTEVSRNKHVCLAVN